MRVAVVMVGGVPNPVQNGGTLTVWTVVHHLLEVGHEVAVVAVLGESDDPGAALEQHVEQLTASGADVRLVRSGASLLFESMDRRMGKRFRRALRPNPEEIFPHLLDSDAVRKAVDGLAPDVAWVYHWDAVAASRALAGIVPRLATVVDPPHLSALLRWRATPGHLTREGLSRLLWLQARLRRQPRLMIELLNECEASANFAAHHASWLQDHGASRCEYLRTPIEDRPGEDWLAHRDRHRAKPRPRLLMIGHLRGISTLEGLGVFAEDVHPRLERALGQDGFEVRVVGDHELPRRLAEALRRPGIRFMGHLPRVDEEFQSADVLLVPTSIRLGARVRILSAFSFGCPVVAHAANSLGIPELTHGDNVLLAREPGELADGALRVIADEELRRRLERRGRETYEQLFAPSVAATALEERMGALAGQPVGARGKPASSRQRPAARKSRALG